MYFKNWTDVAKYCEDTFGAYVDWDEGFFECPECGEPIYECDHNGHFWDICPVCEIHWEEIT